MRRKKGQRKGKVHYYNRLTQEMQPLKCKPCLPHQTTVKKHLPVKYTLDAFMETKPGQKPGITASKISHYDHRKQLTPGKHVTTVKDE
ncbi:Potassium voltage-gated channel subfamily H member [Trichinella pseudospiralis]